MEKESITRIIALAMYDSAASISKIESKNTNTLKVRTVMLLRLESICCP
ncbi:MAG: hypothetical protein ACO1PI_10940 [Bacteroidota bacterium]